MIRFSLIPALVVVALCGQTGAGASGGGEARPFTDRFDTPACQWSSTGRNDYFVLEPGYRLILEGGEGKNRSHLEITVLTETRTVGGVETRVVEERESQGGKLVEVSRNYYALCEPYRDVFYFGEDTDMYENGAVVNHEGSWAAGAAGARAGLFMPARPLLGARHYQEVAPGVALDRVEYVSTTETLKTAAGSFQSCVKTEETTPLEPKNRESKLYAPGVGLVRDEDLLLVSYGVADTRKP